MAEHLKNSRTKEKRNTRRTVKFSMTDALEILQQSLVMCHEAGVLVQVENTERGAVITLAGVNVLAGWLVYSCTGNAPAGVSLG